MRQKQYCLFEKTGANASFQRPKKIHGGSDRRLTGKRKIARPISTKHWIHLVLKSSKAKGQLSLLGVTNKIKVDKIIKKQSQKHGVLIAEYVNMGNHLHIKIKPHSRLAFQRFLKSTTAMIARSVTGAKRSKKFGKFWDALAFTRVLTTRFELLQLKGYFQANRVESQKGYEARSKYLNAFNLWLKELRI